ncbi:MAG TPA: hypothetical protein VGH99_03700, partial [Pseudonocardia sp.]
MSVSMRELLGRDPTKPAPGTVIGTISAPPALSVLPRRKLAQSAGAMIAVSSMAAGAALFGHVLPGPDGTGASDGGYPERGILGSPAQRYPGGVAVNPLGVPLNFVPAS